MLSENAPISRLIGEIVDDHAELLSFFALYQERAPTAIADFVAGNPQEMPLPGFVAAVAKWTTPKSKDHFAYTQSVPEARRAVAASFARRRGIHLETEDIFMTNGAFAGLAVTMRAICDAGDEVVYLSPPWFFYQGMIRSIGAKPIRVDVDRSTWDIDVEAVERAITPRTRAVIVNSPNNPTGRLYPKENLDRLATALEAASARIGRRVYLISDEAYSRILFDGRTYVSPAGSYPHSLLVYTYGKQLLTPGERIGYVALPPTMPRHDREALRDAIVMSQLVSGWMWPNAILQYAAAELEELSIDIAHLQRKRDRVVAGLRVAGYELNVPDGAFYVLTRCPWPDTNAFVEHLASNGVLVLPGGTFEMPDMFRISVTASDEMIDRAIPVFASAIEQLTRV